MTALTIGASVVMSAHAQDFSTPEAAFREHQRAYVARDVPRFLATINFREEALRQLRRTRQSDAGPTDNEIRALALKREADLKVLLETRGFIATDLGKCEIITKWQDSEREVRFPLNCKTTHGSMAFPVRVMRFSEGWRVVRGD